MQSYSENKWKKDLNEKFKDIFKDAICLEIGSALASNDGTFDGTKIWIGLDVYPAPGVDTISIAHKYPAKSGSFDVVCSFSALEHDMYWRKTLRKMYKLTRRGGLIMFSCPLNWEEHGTLRTSPEQSMNTNIPGWENYYENRSPEDIKSVWDVDKLFSDYYLGLNPHDDGFTVFWGIKK